MLGPVAFSREYGAEFSEDISTLIAAEVIRDAIRDYRELPPMDGVKYVAGVDPSGGGADSFTLSIAHADEQRIVVDLVRGWRAAKPESVVGEIVDVLKLFRIGKVSGDRYSGAWVREAFKRHGIQYTRLRRRTARSCIWNSFRF